MCSSLKERYNFTQKEMVEFIGGELKQSTLSGLLNREEGVSLSSIDIEKYSINPQVPLPMPQRREEP